MPRHQEYRIFFKKMSNTKRTNIFRLKMLAWCSNYLRVCKKCFESFIRHVFSRLLFHKRMETFLKNTASFISIRLSHQQLFRFGGGGPIVLIIIKKLDLCSDKKRNCLMNRYNNSCRAPNDKFKQLYNHYFYIFDIQSIQMQTIKMRIKLQRT
jgi:hypothetical protein